MADSIQNPPPIPAVPLAYYAQPFVRRRPVLLSVIAWVASIFGGLGSLGLLTSGLFWVVQHISMGIYGAANAPGMGDYFQYMMIFSFISGVASIPLLVGGIQSLRLRRIGRKLLIGYGIYSLLFSVVSAILTYKVITPMMNNFAMQQTTTMNGATTTTSVPIGATANNSGNSLVEQIFGVAVNYAIVGAILYYLMRPEIKQLFEETPPITRSFDPNPRTES